MPTDAQRLAGGVYGLLIGTRWAFLTSSTRPPGFLRSAATYEQVVKAAVALSHDTDTTAAVAGGIAGIREGLEAIPGRWLSALRGRDLVDPMVTALRELRARKPS